MRIPVEISRASAANGSANGSANSSANTMDKPAVQEDTIIEFGTAREVLFACATRLEFADVLRLRNSDGSLDTEAAVVAVQYHPGATVVAARFLKSVPNWIVKS